MLTLVIINKGNNAISKAKLKDNLNILVFHSSGVDLFLRGPMRCEIYLREKVVLISRSQRLPGLFRWIDRC